MTFGLGNRCSIRLSYGTTPLSRYVADRVAICNARPVPGVHRSQVPLLIRRQMASGAARLSSWKRASAAAIDRCSLLA